MESGFSRDDGVVSLSAVSDVEMTLCILCTFNASICRRKNKATKGLRFANPFFMIKVVNLHIFVRSLVALTFLFFLSCCPGTKQYVQSAS